MDRNSSNWLQEEYNRRRKKNPYFSLRAFARLIDVPPGRVSQYFSNKRKITPAVAKKIAEKLNYDPNKESEFLNVVHRERNEECQESEYLQLSADTFHVISDWHYFAILNLIKVVDFQNDPKWIANRLGISVVEVKTALDRLMRLGLIVCEDGQLKRTNAKLKTTNDIDSRALKIAHEQDLRNAISALYNVDVKKRDITSMTMAIDSKKIPEAKEMIKRFRRRLDRFLETDRPDEVYNLNIQLFPISKQEQ